MDKCTVLSVCLFVFFHVCFFYFYFFIFIYFLLLLFFITGGVQLVCVSGCSAAGTERPPPLPPFAPGGSFSPPHARRANHCHFLCAGSFVVKLEEFCGRGLWTQGPQEGIGEMPVLLRFWRTTSSNVMRLSGKVQNYQKRCISPKNSQKCSQNTPKNDFESLKTPYLGSWEKFRKSPRCKVLKPFWLRYVKISIRLYLQFSVPSYFKLPLQNANFYTIWLTNLKLAQKVVTYLI